MGSIRENQDAILRWLQSRGAPVDFGKPIADGTTPRQRRGCLAKRKFVTEDSARSHSPHMDVYECRYCGSFHLTTRRA